MTDLLIRRRQATETLDEFNKALPSLLGCGPWEERESSNYPPENRYFRCFALGLEILACVADDSEFAEYHFHIHLKPEFWRSDSDFLFEVADGVARKLVIGGYVVLRPVDLSRSGQGGLRYRFDSTAGTMPWQQVLTEKI